MRLSVLALFAVVRLLAPFGTGDWLTVVLVCSLIFLLPFALISLAVTAWNRTLFHCEQIHIYAPGFVVIDSRGHRQGARWDQLFDFRRGAHEENCRSGRIHWDTIRANITNRRAGQRPTLKVTPYLPDSIEICALWLILLEPLMSSGEG